MYDEPTRQECLIEDLQDLRQEIEQLLWAIACEDVDAIVGAQKSCLDLTQSVAVLHGGIVGKTLANERRINREMGMREVLVPLNWSGNFYIPPRKQ